MSKRKQFWVAFLGNLFEHYDTALFSFLSPFLAPLIFPNYEPIIALILTYAIIPLGMLARPLGALFFGYIGDKRGRTQALSLSFTAIAVVSACIAFSPTYEQAGIISPLIFCLSRIIQNFLAAGEIMGGAIFLLENTEVKHHNIVSSFYSASTIGGILLASAGVALISYCGVMEWGWRVLYLVGSITAFCRSAVGFELNIIPSFQPLRTTLWTYRHVLMLIIVTSGFSYACYSVSLVLTNAFIPLISNLNHTDMMGLNTLLLGLDFLLLPIFGFLSSKISREKIMLAALLGVIVGAVPLSMLLQEGNLAIVVGARIALVVVGVAFCAPFHAWVQHLVPANHRYLIISLGYSLGSQMLGASTTTISLWAFQMTGITHSIMWYWVALACITLGILQWSYVKSFSLKRQQH